MKTDVVVQTAALTAGNNSNSLREGSSVFVRVIKKLGNNSFKVAFAGRQFNISSDLQLKEGTAFLAKIKIDGQIIRLQQIKDSINLQNSFQKIDTNGSLQEILSNPEVINYFKKLGLKPDSLNLGLLNQMKELGISFDSSLFEKVRTLAQRFKGRENEAAQIAYILEQKGIKADFESVWAILDRDYNSDFFVDEKNYNTEICGTMFKKFFDSLLKGTAFSDSNKEGVLTLFNHLGFSFGKGENFGSWIKVPFEFSYKKEEVKNGTGSINLFLENEKKVVKKCVILFNYYITKYLFVLYFSRENCKKITVCLPEHLSVSEKNTFISKLKELFPQMDIENVPESRANEFYAEQNEILSFRGMA